MKIFCLIYSELSLGTAVVPKSSSAILNNRLDMPISSIRVFDSSGVFLYLLSWTSIVGVGSTVPKSNINIYVYRDLYQFLL